MLTQERLKELLSYDAGTGVFCWASHGRRRRVGDVAGYWHARSGYWYIKVDGVCYGAHRLAWLYKTGELCDEVDHRNLLRNDNRFTNLRAATRAKNGANKLKQANNTSGYKGVSWDRCRNSWKVQIGGRSIGYFNDRVEAARAYDEAARAAYGEFARTNL